MEIISFWLRFEGLWGGNDCLLLVVVFRGWKKKGKALVWGYQRNMVTRYKRILLLEVSLENFCSLCVFRRNVYPQILNGLRKQL